MGACGGKTCLSLIKRIFQEEGVPLEDVTDPPVRPVFIETSLSTLARSATGGRLMPSNKNYDVIIIGAGSVGDADCLFHG